MKKTSLIPCAMVLFLHTVAQQVPQQNQDFYNYLMKKSKNQKTTANVLLLGGGTLVVTGMLIGLANAAPDGNEAALTAGGAAAGFGFLSMITSIPFYISSATKRQKANELMVGLGWEKTGNCHAYPRPPGYYPSIRLQIRIP